MRVLEKEFGKHQKKFSGNRDVHRGHAKLDHKRIQTDRDPEREVGGDAGELSRTGKFEVAFKEMKIVREDLLQEGESIDKNSHIMFL